SKITVHSNNAPLDSVLSRLMHGTPSTYAIDHRNKKVYITQQVKIQTTLPRGYYSDANNVAISDAAADSIRATSLVKQRTGNTEQKLKFEVGAGNNNGKMPVLIQGIIRNARTSEPMSGASILIDNRYSTTSNQYGEYSLNLPPGEYPLSIMGIGIRELTAEINIHSDGKLNIDVQQQVPTLREVIVSARKTNNIRSTSMGIAKLDITSIKRIPALFGETDILRAITTLPGVKTVGEASTGFNVRGGSTDQNLILYNEGTVYNPSHFFGMFSAFNPEVVKDVELYKGSIPAKYGGRLASVLNVNNREGNKKNITGSAGIGAITGRLQLEGPLDKNKTSFILGGRTTYANWLIGLLPDEYAKSRASFYDANLGVSHRIDSSNNLYFSGYVSNDKFSLNNDTAYRYANRNFSLKWKRALSKRLQGELIAGYDHYQFETYSLENETNAFSMAFRIRQLFGKLNFTYFKSAQHSFDFGLSAISYNLDPGTLKPGKEGSLVTQDIVETEKAIEGGAYFTHIYSPTANLSFSTGLRFSVYSFLGPQDVNYYAPGGPITEGTRTSTITYS
ncbi:MAG: TonB-dependent receptor, partial [Chitinophagaceae bacterium]|nr:TonB-dependent receptor [Chitinophagaceae bacterium]